MSIIEGATLRITAQFTNGAGSRSMNVYHAELISPTPADDDDVLACALAYVEAIMATMEDGMSTLYELETVELFELAAGEWGPVGQASGSWVGIGTGDQLPPGSALLVNAFKARSGYSDKKYFGGLLESGQNAGTWTGSIVAVAELAAAIWVGEFTDGTVTIQPRAFNRGTLLTTAYNGEIAVNAVVSYQRRRRQGVGLT